MPLENNSHGRSSLSPSGVPSVLKSCLDKNLGWGAGDQSTASVEVKMANPFSPVNLPVTSRTTA
jgi:hypothetical protein